MSSESNCRSTDEAIDGIFAGGAEQCEMVAAAVRNPDVDVGWVQRMAFEYLVRVIRAEAEESQAPSAQRFLRAAKLFERLTRDAGLVAFDLAREWRCGVCGEDVPGRIFVREVRSREPRAQVECVACHQRSDLGEAGERKLRDTFRENLAAGWNPRFNNFEWDGT